MPARSTPRSLPKLIALVVLMTLCTAGAYIVYPHRPPIRHSSGIALATRFASSDSESTGLAPEYLDSGLLKVKLNASANEGVMRLQYDFVVVVQQHMDGRPDFDPSRTKVWIDFALYGPRGRILRCGAVTCLVRNTKSSAKRDPFGAKNATIIESLPFSGQPTATRDNNNLPQFSLTGQGAIVLAGFDTGLFDDNVEASGQLPILNWFSLDSSKTDLADFTFDCKNIFTGVRGDSIDWSGGVPPDFGDANEVGWAVQSATDGLRVGGTNARQLQHEQNRLFISGGVIGLAGGVAVEALLVTWELLLMLVLGRSRSVERSKQ